MVAFLILTFLPMISIKGTSLPIVLLLVGYLLVKKRVIINKKILISGFLASIILIITYIPVLIVNNSLTLKDALFSLYPIIIVIIYTVLTNFDTKNDAKIIFYMKAFLFIELIICIVQLVNPFDINEKLKNILYFWQKTNAQKYSNYLEVSYRPFGTIGSPIFLAVLCYFVGKTLEFKLNTKKYFIISLIVILLTGARMPLLAAILIELIEILTKEMKKKPVKAIIYILIIAVVLIISFKYIPFLNKIYNDFIIKENNISNDYSFSYRTKMIEFFKENIGYSFVGGYGINNFPTYVDIEYVLRIIQFGMINYLLIISPYIVIFSIVLKKIRKKYLIFEIISFVLLCMTTSIIITNIYVIQYILLVAIIFMKEGEKNENSVLSV